MPTSSGSRVGRTLKKRAADVLAYFDRPGTYNGPTEAINGRLEHLLTVTDDVDVAVMVDADGSDETKTLPV